MCTVREKGWFYGGGPVGIFFEVIVFEVIFFGVIFFELKLRIQRDGVWG